MQGRKAPALALSAEERAELEKLVRRHSTPQQLALRGRMVLAVAEGSSNSAIARQMGVGIKLVAFWRRRWLSFTGITLADLGVEARLRDAPRPGAPARITPEQVCRIVALACETPAESDRPISQWTTREIAAEVIKRGIVDRISPSHAASLLKSGRSETPSHPLLANAGT
jgi:putative transposase